MSVLTKTSGRQDTNHGLLIFCFGLSVFCSTIELLIHLIGITTSNPDFDSYNYNFSSAWGVSLVCMSKFLKNYLRTEHIFLEAKYTVWRFIFIGIGIFLIGLGFLNVIKFFGLPFIPQNLTIHFDRPSFLGIYIGSLLIYAGNNRYQFCEKGLKNGELIPWDTIEWYEWIINNEKRCKLQLKSKGDLFGRLKIEIPVEKKENVEALFQKHSIFLHDPND